jgi:hypothetical protein
MANTAKVGDTFSQRIKALLRDYDELILAAHQKKRQASLETMLSEQTVMALAVFWESFMHDLLIAHVVRRPRPCLRGYSDRIHQSLSEKYPGASRWVSVEFPSAPTLTQIQRLLDPKGWNIVAPSALSLRELANRLLHASDARKFALNADDAAFVDYLTALRNFLGHRSEGSRETLLNAMRAITQNSANGELHGTARHVGKYLKTHTQSGTRVDSIGKRILDIAATLSA